MTKTRTAVILGAFAVAAFTFLYFFYDKENIGSLTSPFDDVAAPVPVSPPGPAVLEGFSLQEQLSRDASRSVQIQMAPEKAYADAMAMQACTLAVTDAELPDDLTSEQKAQYQASRIEELDCSVLESKFTAQQLAKYAAERGNVQAQIDYAAIAAPMFDEEQNALNPALIAEFKADSLRFLNAAAATGNTDALMRLSVNYQQGLFADKDLAKAYAYAYAKNQLSPSQMTKKMLDGYADDLSANELLRAQQLGRSLINRN